MRAFGRLVGGNSLRPSPADKFVTAIVRQNTRGPFTDSVCMCIATCCSLSARLLLISGLTSLSLRRIPFNNISRAPCWIITLGAAFLLSPRSRAQQTNDFFQLLSLYLSALFKNIRRYFYFSLKSDVNVLVLRGKEALIYGSPHKSRPRA